MKTKQFTSTVYLACAYSSKIKWLGRIIMWWRYHNISKLAAKIMEKRNRIVFSPITHSHIIAKKGKMKALSHEFWLGQDKWYVDRCDEVWVYKGLGFEKSTGVKREIEWALEQNKPVLLVNKHADVVDYL